MKVAFLQSKLEFIDHDSKPRMSYQYHSTSFDARLFQCVVVFKAESGILRENIHS